MDTNVASPERLAWLDPFFAELARAPRRALLLDYDGTLAPFRVQRNEAQPYPGVMAHLQRIGEAGGTRLVFITGRRVQNLTPLLPLTPLPEIWGSHGRERRHADGRLEVLPLEPEDEAATHRIAERLTELGLSDRTEHKPGCVTLHLRGLDLENAGLLREQMIEEAPGLIGASAMQVRDYHGGVEFYLTDQHKGHAVETVLAECGADCPAAFLGDDVTDEDAFRTMKQRDSKRIARVGILVRAEPRASAARHWLRPPDELLDFLRRWASLGGTP